MNPSGSVPDPVGGKFEVKNGGYGRNPVGLDRKPVGCTHVLVVTNHSSLIFQVTKKPNWLLRTIKHRSGAPWDRSGASYGIFSDLVGG